MKLIEQKLAKINDRIDSFINYGINLREICEKYEKISNDLRIDNNQEVNNYVKKLDDLEMELSKYDQLLNVLINFNEIYKQTLFYKIKGDTIKNIVKQVIDNSGNIICLNNNQDDIENQLLNKIYKMIYDIMKLEIVSINETNLFNYFADEDLSKQFINDFIKEDLIKIKNKFSV